MTVASKQGTALQLVDRVAGPSDVEGVAGSQDGRLDVFLDRGEHLLVTNGHEKASGAATLAVHAFTERHAPQVPLLVELKPVDDGLGDFEQTSFWLEIKTPRAVVFEAAGRNLADLRLWTQGEWLIDATPETEIVTPIPGRPLRLCRLAVRLDPGSYLLTAYGGAPLPWSEAGAEHPFHLRFGIPRLAEVGRSRHVIGPFGYDQWVVPGKATYFRVELPEARPATLEVGAFDDAHPFARGERTAQIAKSALLPVAETELAGSGNRDKLIVIRAAPGQPYVLQHFDLGRPFFGGGRVWEIDDPGSYWVSTVHSGDPADSVDATALLTRAKHLENDASHVEPLAAQTVELGADSRWARRCNLLEPLDLFVHVREAGAFAVVSRGVDASFRFQPFLLRPPEHYQPPDFKPSGSPWNLDPGYYVLEANPLKRGIADLAIVPAVETGAADLLRRLLGGKREGDRQPLRPAIQFPDLEIERDYDYTLIVNQQPDVRVGLVLRRLPVDLTQPLPVVQMPGETVSVRVKVDEAGALTAQAEDGSLVPVALDGAPAKREQHISAGEHRLAVEPSGAIPVHYDLRVEPLQLRADAPLPPLPDTATVAPPALPVATEAEPQFFDLDRDATKTFLLRVDTPALYRVQTTGLLSTEGRMRTRTITAFDSAAENGVGHNFFLQPYLREGDYQVTVRTLGSSRGHLGLTLEQTPLIDGGSLTLGVPARLELPAGQGVIYTFDIPAAGTYRLRSMGERASARCRIEDAAGWPIEKPNLIADLTRAFEPGHYRVVSLPEPVGARRLTLLEPVASPATLAGHGPHALRLDQPAQLVWMEPEGSAERAPDRWELTLPAAIDATIDLSNGMEGVLLLQPQDNAPAQRVAEVPAGRGWKGRLDAGRYRLETKSAVPNNRQPYTVAVSSRQLVAGLDRDVQLPATVPISVGTNGLVRLSSFGSVDVSARLYDGQDRLVASNDDAPADWNFQVETRLAAGEYRLQVDSVAPEQARVVLPSPTPTPNPDTAADRNEEVDDSETHASRDQSCVISMRAPTINEGEPLALPAEAQIQLGGDVEVRPLSVLGSGLLLLSAGSREGAGIALEASGAAGWQTLGSSAGPRAVLAVPIDGSVRRYRLRLWSPSLRQTTVALRAEVADPTPVSELRLAKGIALTVNRAHRGRPQRAVPFAPLGSAHVELERPGVFHLRRAPDGLRVCSATDVPCRTMRDGTAIASAPGFWFASVGPKKRIVAGERVRLGAAESGLHVDLQPGDAPSIDLAAEGGGPVLVMATAQAGQPGVRLLDEGEPARPGGAMGVGDSTAVALHLAPPQQTAALVWSASTGGETMGMHVQRIDLPPPEVTRALFGTSESTLAGRAARELDLPRGAKRVRFALQGSTIAALGDDERVLSVHWRGGEPFEESIDTEATRLFLFHLGDGEERAEVTVFPTEDRLGALSVGTPFERIEMSAGILRLEVDAGAAPRTLHLRSAGEATVPVLLTSEGRVERGADLALDASAAVVQMPHPPGLVLAWIDRPGEEGRALWGSTAAGAPVEVHPPAVLDLSGAIRALRVRTTEPSLLHLRSAVPTVTLLQRDGQAAEVQVHRSATALDAYLPAGAVTLALRAVAGASLSGTAELTTVPVTAIGEGLGPEILLAAGGSRLFSFEVTEKGPVGVGVRGNPDVVEATLLDHAGNMLGSGVVQMPTLEPGTYLLSLHAPPDRGPVVARPAVAGVQRPGTGPPAEVIRRYMQLASERGAPAAAANEE